MSDVLAHHRSTPASSRQNCSPGEEEGAEVKARIEVALASFLDAKERAGAAGGAVPEQLAAVLREFIGSGGKRVRPLLCVLGWRAAGGVGLPRPVVGVAAALEMFHVVALIHDDLMDGAATRRRRPAVHRQLAQSLGAGLPRERTERLGESAAILAGDLALTWSDELLYTALTPDRLADVLPLVGAMRAEAVYGQYLDVTAAGRREGGVPLALRIARYKTATYTVQRPLHIGATLAGAPAELLEGLSAYAVPTGEAFQLRDDLLGAFGDPGRTGKSAWEDLRDGKHTVLVALARERATPAQAHVLETLLGAPALDEDGVRQLRRVLVDSGARAEVERLIAERRAQAFDALQAMALPGPVAEELACLTHRATARRH
ncbi:polyprenyl synthetase family protein [Streptomyces polychromogenes]|uniref:Polyprenyl synthetase family protein n=1 Tax=Streptomyces polychromogenes TaxID=67342 RepID=A0ABN0V1N9_9ACTN